MSRESVLGGLFAALIFAFWIGIGCLWIPSIRMRIAGASISAASVAAFMAIGVGIGWR